MITAVLFDLDGTLVGTKRLYLEAYRRVSRIHALRELSDDDLMAMRPRSELKMLRALLADVNDHEYERCCDTFYAEYASLHASHFDGVYPGVPEMLDDLRTRGALLGIVTGKSRRAWQITSASAELGALDVAVLDDEVRHPKPDPHGILIALERLGVGAEQAAYVGDTRSDMEAAATAGVLPVWAAWSRPADSRPRMARQVSALGARIAESPAAVACLLSRT